MRRAPELAIVFVLGLCHGRTERRLKQARRGLMSEGIFVLEVACGKRGVALVVV